MGVAEAVLAFGLRFLWRSGRPLWRALAWAYGLLFVLFAVTTGAKIYYLAGAYPYLLAAGFVAVDGWLAARRGRVRNLMLATALTTAAAALPIVPPVLPAADIGWTYQVNNDGGESIGWPQLVQAVHTAWVSLPPAQRAHAVIFTSNYGEAGRTPGCWPPHRGPALAWHASRTRRPTRAASAGLAALPAAGNSSLRVP